VRTGDDSKEHHVDPGDYWSGKLDEVMVINDALSAEQIKTLANLVLH